MTNNTIYLDPEYIECYGFFTTNGDIVPITAERALGHELAHLFPKEALSWGFSHLFVVLDRMNDEAMTITAGNKIARELDPNAIDRVSHNMKRLDSCGCNE